MKALKSTVIEEYRQKVDELNKRISERGMQLFQEQFLDQPFSLKPSHRWFQSSRFALNWISHKPLQITREKYQEVAKLSTCIGHVDFLTNEQFAILSNSGEAAGPAVLELWDEDFIAFQDEQELLVAKYHEDLQAAREAIDKQIQDEFAEEQKALYEQYQAPKN